LAAAAAALLWVRAEGLGWFGVPHVTVTAESEVEQPAPAASLASTSPSGVTPAAPEVAAAELSPEPAGKNEARVATASEAVRAKPALGAAAPKSSKAAGKMPSNNGLDFPEGPSPGMVPAAQGTALPDHPSAGAVQAAVAGNVSRASGCLPAGAEPVGVQLTFDDRGRVQQMSLPSTLSSSEAACVRSSLGSTTLSPFARPSYTVGVTLRPRVQVPATKK